MTSEERVAEETTEQPTFVASVEDQQQAPKEPFAFSKIWSTRDIQAVKHFNRETYLKVSLFEFLIFIVFCFVVVLLMETLRTVSVFFFCNAIAHTFIKVPISHKDYHITFDRIATQAEFYEYLTSTLMYGLYNTSGNSSENWVMYQNMLVGHPQLRQTRVGNNTCLIPSNIQSKIAVCYGAYSQENLDKQPLKGKYGTTFTEKLDSSTVNYYGMLSSYGAEGYYVDLGGSINESISILSSLQKETWIDRGTRAVFVDFFLYNPSVHTVCSVTLVGEFSMTGGVFTSHLIRTVRLMNYTPSLPGFGIVYVFGGFILAYAAEELLELLVLRDSYFGLFSTYLDLLIVLCGCLVCITIMFCSANSETISNEIWTSSSYASNILFMSYMQHISDIILAFLVFLVFIKLFKYLSFNETMTKLSSTIYTSSKDLLGYSVLFFFVILSFGLLGMLLFGYQVTIFSSLWYSIVALFRILLGDIDFEYIDDKHSIIGAIYLIIYVVTIYFILMNVFLAIIFESYSKVKAMIEKKTFEIYLWDYFKLKCRRGGAIHAKKKCSQWVSEMLNQGYPEKAVQFVIYTHRKQGLTLDTWLSNHQVLTLSYELENYMTASFTYEKMGTLEKQFEDLQERLEHSVSKLVKKQNEHKIAMAKLLDLINESEATGAEKEAEMYQLIKNELSHG